MTAVYKLQCFGSNGSGQLGVGHEEDLMLPITSFVSKGIGIKKVACGGNHSLLLLEDGSLFWCGDNSVGQCAPIGKENADTPNKSCSWVSVPGKYIDVACGWEFSVVIDSEGMVMTRGKGCKGELGVPEVTESDVWNALFRVQDRRNATCHAAFQHCAVVDRNVVFAWGNNRKQQTCGESSLKVVDSPREIYHGRGSSEYVRVAVGKDFTFILVDKEGKQDLILQGPLQQELPRIISKLDADQTTVKQFASMWSSLHLLTESGHLISIGRGSHGQFLQNPIPSNTIGFAAGSEHGILVTSGVEVYCWGWGEHGNCGPLRPQGSSLESENHVTSHHVNDKSNVISPLNLIGKYENVEAVYGGCATTWIVARSD